MSDPNPQNIPIRTLEGAAVRRAFITIEAWASFKLDLATTELQVAPQVPSYDDYVMRAAELFGVEPSAVTPEMRRRAKQWLFCKVYGGSAERLADILKGVK